MDLLEVSNNNRTTDCNTFECRVFYYPFLIISSCNFSLLFVVLVYHDLLISSFFMLLHFQVIHGHRCISRMTFNYKITWNYFKRHQQKHQQQQLHKVVWNVRNNFPVRSKNKLKPPRHTIKNVAITATLGRLNDESSWKVKEKEIRKKKKLNLKKNI